MSVTDTKPLEKCCSKCGEIKIENMFIPKRNICKECRNKTSREKYKVLEINENEEQQLIAFNWRNTMPLSCQENLKKNNKIIKLQIEQHYKKLVEYHLENKLDLPQVYIDLFAKHLVAGSPLEPI